MQQQNNQDNPNQKQQQIQIKLTDDVLRGSYANAMSVSHTKEEFILDFLNLFPPQGVVNARVIMTPSHLKRVIIALSNNLKMYEDKFGKVEESQPIDPQMGFQDRETQK